MKTLDPTFAGYITGAPARYALLFTLRLTDDTTYLFTNFQRNITLPGVSPVTYKASNAIEVSAIESTTGGIAQNAELKIFYVDNLERDQVLSGLMDDALFLIDLVDWSHPEAQSLRLMTGTLQRKSIADIKFGQWYVKGQLGKLDGLIGEIYSEECRNILGDANCGVDLTLFTEDFSVSTVLAGYEYTRFTCSVTGAREAGFFTLGTASFGIGVQKFEILSDTGTSTRTIILAVPRNQIISFGDTGKLIAGCDKRHTSCLFKFDNIVRMRAEPFKPVGSLQVQT